MPTNAEILAALFADSEARAYADLGDDGAAAARLSSILPAETVSRRVREHDVMTAFVDPLAGDAFLTALEDIAAGGSTHASVTNRALRWLRDPEGLDVGHPWVQNFLTALAANGSITPTAAQTVAAMAHVRPTVTAEQVATILEPYRPHGRATPLPPTQN